jgi:FkbM family methyltransferase
MSPSSSSTDISVLLPTRNRAELLERSIRSLLDLAERPESVEILLAVDPDAIVDLPCGRGHVWVAPERFGSTRMHEYYNHLATMASGTWLMIWNDDATMLTRGWDDIVRSHPGICLWFDHGDPGFAHCNMFPIWPRAWTEITGYVADGSPRVDTWLQEVAELLDRQVKVPVQVRHETPDDLTWREGNVYDLPQFHSLRPLREREAQNLRNRMPEIREADGLQWSVNPDNSDDHIGPDPHEANLEPVFRELLGENHTFLDVGAHVGRWSLRLAGQAKHVIAIEASPETYKVLLANISLNGIGNITAINVAAWDSRGRLTLYDPGRRHHSASARVLPDNGRDRSVKCAPLDDVLEGQQVDFIKLDVEGADLHALRGLQRTLSRCKPVMLIEDHSTLGYYEQADLHTLLDELGYRNRRIAASYLESEYIVAEWAGI